VIWQQFRRHNAELQRPTHTHTRTNESHTHTHMKTYNNHTDKDRNRLQSFSYIDFVVIKI